MALLWLCLALMVGQRCFAQNGELSPIKLESAGVRYGFPANNIAHGLKEVEAFSNLSLPWIWDFDIFQVHSRLDLDLGWIGGHSDNPFVGSLAPSLQFRRRGFPIQLDFGSGPTYLSRHEWGDINVATQLQFTTHAGIDWDITRHLRIGYRFTHMSNAGIKEPNPGINMHLVGVSVLF